MWEILFFKDHAENEAGRLVLDLFSFLEKSFIGPKSKFSSAL